MNTFWVPYHVDLSKTGLLALWAEHVEQVDTNVLKEKLWIDQEHMHRAKCF